MDNVELLQYYFWRHTKHAHVLSCGCHRKWLQKPPQFARRASTDSEAQTLQEVTAMKWKLFLVLLVFAVVVVVDARSPGQPKNYNYSPRSKVKDGVYNNRFMIDILYRVTHPNCKNHPFT